MIQSVLKNRLLRASMASLVLSAAISGFAANSAKELPKVIILGKQYYCYECKKGDSLFGIANQYGWDTNVVNELNPNVASPIAKGTLIYYPVSDDIPVADENDGGVTSERVTHLVQSGETIYGISRAYNLPMEELYALNPSARNGIKAGEILVIAEKRVIEKPSSETGNTVESIGADEQGGGVLTLQDDENYVYHNLKPGENLYDIAVRYDTRVEDIYRLNPGLSPNKIGEETIRLLPGTRSSNVRYETVTEQSVVSIDSYKVRKGDTWGSVSASLGVDQQALRDANPGKWKLKKGDVINVPHTEDVEVEHSYVEIDPREQSAEGLRELYDEVHDMDIAADGRVINNAEVKVAIILDDTSSNKDMEFARGALLGIDRLKNSDFRSNIIILDGGAPMSKVLTQLETFGPDLLISTSDKTLPQYLIEYSQRTGTELVNSFDVKSEAYLDTPTVFQFLTPTSYFNESVLDYVKDELGERRLIVVGQSAGADILGDMIIKSFGTNSISTTVDDIEKLPLDEMGKYIIYVPATKQKDVDVQFEKISALQTANPLADIKVFGRANWVTFGNGLSEKYSDVDFLIPSRFFFNPDDPESRRFINDYQQMYGQTPVKSYPVYSVAAYDIITYFVPNINHTNGDINGHYRASDTLQSSMQIERVSNWSGMYNPGCFIIEYSIPGSPFKISIPR